MPSFSSPTPFNITWSGVADYSLRPTLMVARDGSGFRPVDISTFGSGGGGGSTTTNGQVGITGSNGQAVQVVNIGGTNAFPVAIISGQTIVSGASIILTGVQSVEQIIDYGAFTPLSFNGITPTTTWIAFNTLSSYFVPGDKSLKIDGYSCRTDGAVAFMAAIRENMFSFSYSGSAFRPIINSITPKTITGFDGLTTGSSYSYRVVACNNIGRTNASPTGTVTLAGTQNATTIITSNIGEGYIEIYRSPANGGSGTERFLASTASSIFLDCIPDSELSSDVVPSSDTTTGSFYGFTYPSGRAPSHVVMHTYTQASGIASFSPVVEMVYKNIYRKNRNIRIPAAPASSFLEICTSSSTGVNQNSSIVSQFNRIPRRVEGHEWDDGGINQILHVSPGETGANFTIFGYSPLFYVQSTSGSAWTTEIFPKTMLIPSGKEVVIAVSSRNAVASSRVDLTIYGRLV